jgi:hypothetical protein
MSYVLFVCKCVLPPGINPIAVEKYTNIFRPSGLMLSPVKNYGGVHRRNQRRSKSNTGNGSGRDMH